MDATVTKEHAQRHRPRPGIVMAVMLMIVPAATAMMVSISMLMVIMSAMSAATIQIIRAVDTLRPWHATTGQWWTIGAMVAVAASAMVLDRWADHWEPHDTAPPLDMDREDRP